MKEALARAATVGGSVSGRDSSTLNAVFAHPISHNLAWTDVVKLVGHLGSVDEHSHEKIAFRIGQEKHAVHKSHAKHLTATELIQLRHFIDRAGCSPDQPSHSPNQPDPAAPNLIIVIDHQQAKIFHTDPGAGEADRPTVGPLNPHHVVHNAAQNDRSSGQREGATANRTYYQAIAQLVTLGGRIVVLGHGKGEGNAAHQLVAYLGTHHPKAYQRVVGEVSADLPHLSQAQLLEIGRAALMQKRALASPPTPQDPKSAARGPAKVFSPFVPNLL
jgi:hypothetical protein